MIVVLQAGRAPAADVSWAGSREQSGTLYWVYWGSSGCNLIQYPAITEPRCLLSLPDPPKTHTLHLCLNLSLSSSHCPPSFPPSTSFIPSIPVPICKSMEKMLCPSGLGKLEKLKEIAHKVSRFPFNILWTDLKTHKSSQDIDIRKKTVKNFKQGTINFCPYPAQISLMFLSICVFISVSTCLTFPLSLTNLPSAHFLLQAAVFREASVLSS